MLIIETVGDLVHTYSDKGMKIHGGFPEADYDEAYDPIDAGRTYIETDIPIDLDEESEDETEVKVMGFDILMGEIK